MTSSIRLLLCVLSSLTLFTLGAQVASAGPSKEKPSSATEQVTESLVKEYLQTFITGSTSVVPTSEFNIFPSLGPQSNMDDCEDKPNRPTCVRTACEINPTMCDDHYDLTRTREACGTASGLCVSVACKINKSMCDDHYDLKDTANACTNTNGRCVAAGCKANASMCDDKYDLASAGEACRGTDGDCVQYVCERNPSSCDDVYDLKRTAEACKPKNLAIR